MTDVTRFPFSFARCVPTANSLIPGLIGGQAVTFWAGLYAFRESALGELKSFTNEDIDFKGDRSDVEHIAAQLKLRAVLPGKVGMTALAGSIPFTWGTSSPTSMLSEWFLVRLRTWRAGRSSQIPAETDCHQIRQTRGQPNGL